MAGKRKEVEWTDDAVAAFQHAKEALATATMLMHPRVDAPTSLTVDALQVGHWAITCIPCQTAKVQRHVRVPLEEFIVPRQRFDHIHVDIVGPLPPSRGFTHLLTGRPFHVVAGGGSTVRHFCLSLCPCLGGSLDCQLKAVLKARLVDPDWVDTLPWVLLGVRTAPKEVLSTSSAELVYGAPLTVHATWSYWRGLTFGVPALIPSVPAVVFAWRSGSGSCARRGAHTGCSSHTTPHTGASHSSAAQSTQTPEQIQQARLAEKTQQTPAGPGVWCPCWGEGGGSRRGGGGSRRGAGGWVCGCGWGLWVSGPSVGERGPVWVARCGCTGPGVGAWGLVWVPGVWCGCLGPCVGAWGPVWVSLPRSGCLGPRCGCLGPGVGAWGPVWVPGALCGCGCLGPGVGARGPVVGVPRALCGAWGPVWVWVPGARCGCGCLGPGVGVGAWGPVWVPGARCGCLGPGVGVGAWGPVWVWVPRALCGAWGPGVGVGAWGPVWVWVPGARCGCGCLGPFVVPGARCGCGCLGPGVGVGAWGPVVGVVAWDPVWVWLPGALCGCGCLGPCVGARGQCGCLGPVWVPGALCGCGCLGPVWVPGASVGAWGPVWVPGGPVWVWVPGASVGARGQCGCQGPVWVPGASVGAWGQCGCPGPV
ncbi:uncharacterized protein LOC144611375 [Rhinoraja longicauda]